MNTIGKITVRHFLNSRIKPSSHIIGGNDENGNFDPERVPRPLYIKVTFRRKSTELKSAIDRTYYNMNELKPQEIELMDAEAKMINQIITEECEGGNRDISWSILKERMDFYKRHAIDEFRNNFLLKKFEKVILNTKSEYMRLLLSRDPRVPLTTVYNAAKKLLPRSQELFQFDERVAELEKINAIFQKMNCTRFLMIMEWEFGKAKEDFAATALKAGWRFKDIEHYINLIDSVYKKIK